MIKAVIFDLDGTIVDFKIDFKAARIEVMLLLINEGIPDFLSSENRSIYAMLEKAKKHMRDQGKEEQEFVKLSKKAFEVVERYEAKAARETNLLPGMLETLQALRRMKLKIALFTANSEKPTNYTLERFHLRQFFDAIVTRESVSSVKPDPIHLDAVLKTLRVEPEEAIVIGDSIRDIECAHRLGVLVVGVTTGSSSKEELTSACPHYLVSSSKDILSILQQLCMKS